MSTAQTQPSAGIRRAFHFWLEIFLCGVESYLIITQICNQCWSQIPAPAGQCKIQGSVRGHANLLKLYKQEKAVGLTEIFSHV